MVYSSLPPEPSTLETLTERRALRRALLGLLCGLLTRRGLLCVRLRLSLLCGLLNRLCGRLRSGFAERIHQCFGKSEEAGFDLVQFGLKLPIVACVHDHGLTWRFRLLYRRLYRRLLFRLDRL